MQFAKVIEEIGELAHELTRGNCGADIPPSEDTIDAFGDICVTLIILADIMALDLPACLLLAYNVIKDRTGETKNGSFVKDNE